MTGEYNPELCNERHGDIKAMITEIFSRLKKVENRFLAMMTLLIANLLGVCLILARTLMVKP